MKRRETERLDYVVETCLEVSAELSKLEYLACSFDRRLKINRDERGLSDDGDREGGHREDRVFLNMGINEVLELETSIDGKLKVLERFLPKNEFWSIRTEFSHDLTKALEGLERCNGSEGPAIADLESHYLLQQASFPFGPIFDVSDVISRVRPFREAILSVLDRRLT